MNPGQLRERVRFERRLPSLDDGYGNVQTGWVPLITMAAAIDPGAGKEEIEASKLQGVQPYEITVRWSAVSRGILPSDRAVNARIPTQVYNILAASNKDRRRRWMTFTAIQGTASG